MSWENSGSICRIEETILGEIHVIYAIFNKYTFTLEMQYGIMENCQSKSDVGSAWPNYSTTTGSFLATSFFLYFIYIHSSKKKSRKILVVF